MHEMHEKYFVNPQNILKFNYAEEEGGKDHNLAVHLKRWRSAAEYKFI